MVVVDELMMVVWTEDEEDHLKFDRFLENGQLVRGNFVSSTFEFVGLELLKIVQV